MSSTVEFRLEDSLAELEEQLRHGVWNSAQVRRIVATRRQHELSVQRAGATRSDYLKYIEYEINLDQLRREKIHRLGEESAKKKKKKKKTKNSTNSFLSYQKTIVFAIVQCRHGSHSRPI
jgi:U3 small nucleolar RNA-associated protein 6